MHPENGLKTILLAGLTCGVLDGISATLVSRYGFGGTPMRLFQGISSGLLGRRAFEGGAGTMLLGIALHFVVVLGAAAVYYLASRRLRVLTDQPLICGVVYGVFVHLFMTFVVIPLSAIGSRPLAMRSFLAFLAVSMIVIGPSIALTVRARQR